MGVSWVIQIPTEANKSPSQLVDGMNQRILALGAVKSGQHAIDCDVYQSAIPHIQMTCYQMHNSEYPVSTFAILDTHTCVTADNLLDLLLLKLNPLYDKRKNLSVECKGTRFELDDFVFKTGTVQMSQTKSDLGVLLEIEYMPVVVASNCYALMKDMAQSLCGRQVDIPDYLKLRGNEVHTPNDTMQQYLEHFNYFKKVQYQHQLATSSHISVCVEEVSQSDPAQTYLVSPDSVILDLTHPVHTPANDLLGNNSEKALTDSLESGEATEDDLSLSAANCHGDGVSSNSRAGDRSASSEFVTASSDKTAEFSPDTSTKRETLSTESSIGVSSLRSTSKTVRTSLCKSPIMSGHLAKMMGCQVSFIPRPKRQSARIQTRYKLRETSTQSDRVPHDQVSVQTSQHTAAAAAQTSRTSLKAHTELEDNESVTSLSGHTQRLRPEKLVWNAKAKVSSLENYHHQPGGGHTAIPMRKLRFRKTAVSKVNSLTDYQPAGGQKRITNEPINFRKGAKSKIGSLDNVFHKPKGGDKKIYQVKLTFRQAAAPKVGSLANVSHQPGGGNKKIIYQIVPRRPNLPSATSSGHEKPLKRPMNVKDHESLASDTSETITGCSPMVTDPIKRSASHHHRNHGKLPNSATSQSVSL